ncbi:phage tail tape measure protein [Clostridium tertium]|uniref:phage tail tape measure protein n=1 Tax=Clostridium tertium TaxID=1559 RepID=UPI0018A0D9F1|nr:phage tail tape measure protein [Clostridium tertium]MDB1947669.1 phage tail tape measure protein [Clostridium tertium]
MASRELQVRIGVNTGSAESQLKALNVNIKNTKSEFDKAGAGIKDFEKTTQGSKAKVKMLTETLEAQGSKLKILKKQITETEQTLKSSTQAYNNQKQKVSDLNSKLEQAKKTYGENSKEVKALNKELKEAEKDLKAKEKAVISCDNKLVGLKTSLNKTEAEMRSLKAQIKDTSTSFGDLARKANDVALKGVGTALQGVGGALKGIGGAVAGVGTAMTVGITMPVNRLKKEALELGGAFEVSMSNVKALTSASSEEMEVLEKKARQLGSTTTKSAKEAGDGMGYLALAGYSVEEMLVSIEPLLRLSEATQMDLALASDLATDSLSAMGLGAKDLEGYLNVLAQTQRSSNTTAKDMMEAYIGVGGMFKNLNVPLQESATWIGVLANKGIKGSEAGNALSSTLINLTTGAGQAGEAMKELNLSAYDSEGKFKGVSKVMQELKEKLSTLTDEQRDYYLAMIGGKTNVDTLNAMLSSLGEEYDSLYEKVGNSEGALQSLAETMNDNSVGIKKNLNSALEELKLKIFEVIKPMEDLKNKVMLKLLTAFNALPEPISKNIIRLVLLIATIAPLILAIGGLVFVIGTAVSAIGSFVAGLASCALPIVAVVAGAYLLYEAIKQNFDNIKLSVENLRLAFEENFAPIQEGFSTLWTIIQEAWATVGEPLITAIGELIVIVVNFIADVLPGISTAFSTVCDALKTAWETVGKPVLDFVMEVVDILVAWFEENLPTIAETFNSVMDTLSVIWETVGKPLFDVIKIIISTVIEVLKPIINSLMEAFSVCFEAIKVVWETVLKPVIETISKVIGKMIEIVKPIMESFKECITTAMNLVIEPIQWVIDKFKSLVEWVGKIGDKVGTFLNKFNPFKSKTIDMDMNINTSGVQEFGNIALSGQYYNARTPRAGEVNDLISGRSIQVENDSTKELLASMNAQNTILTKMLEALLAERTMVVDNTINLDGRAIARGTAKFIEREISTLNKRANRMTGLAY